MKFLITYATTITNVDLKVLDECLTYESKYNYVCLLLYFLFNLSIIFVIESLYCGTFRPRFVQQTDNIFAIKHPCGLSSRHAPKQIGVLKYIIIYTYPRYTYTNANVGDNKIRYTVQQVPGGYWPSPSVAADSWECDAIYTTRDNDTRIILLFKPYYII